MRKGGTFQIMQNIFSLIWAEDMVHPSESSVLLLFVRICLDIRFKNEWASVCDSEANTWN